MRLPWLRRPRSGPETGAEGDTGSGEKAGANDPSYQYVLVWDQDTARELSGSLGPSKHRSTLTFDSERLHQGMECTLDIRQPEQLPVQIKCFKAQHTDDVPGAVGLRLSFLDENNEPKLVVGHTADTQYFPELANELGPCDLLFAHISQPFYKEYAEAWLAPERREEGYYQRGSHETGYFKGGHLGLRGTIELIREVKPKLVVIGEFWPGIADLRIALTRVIQERAKIDGKLHSVILPGSRSLRLRLPELEVICTECNDAVPASHIQVAPAELKFGKLGYICHQCRS